jgi:putative SOS response-associated peptidase YedK
MCGRVYETYTDEELYICYLSKPAATPLILSPVYNLCPTQNSPVLRMVASERQFDLMRWQLVPFTEPAFTTKLSTTRPSAKANSIEISSAASGPLVLLAVGRGSSRRSCTNSVGPMSSFQI